MSLPLAGVTALDLFGYLAEEVSALQAAGAVYDPALPKPAR